MNDFKFSSLNELYNHLYPAFNTKVNMLKKENIIVKEIDLWNYLKENKWKNSKNLDIYTMVDNILFLNENEIKKNIEGENSEY